MNVENKVYNPAREIKVPAHHKKPNTYYIVSYGLVDWDKNGDFKPAVYIIMEYNGFRAYQQPAHIITEKNADGKSDFDNVMEAINKLKEEYEL